MYDGFRFTVEFGPSDRSNVKRPVNRARGVDWGAPMELIHQNGRFAVVYVRGHSSISTFRNIGGYYPARYRLVEIEPAEPDCWALATVLETVEPGREWRPAQARLIARCDALAGPPKATGGRGRRKARVPKGSRARHPCGGYAYMGCRCRGCR